MARELEQGAAPLSRADLLDRYVRSDLDDAGYAAELTTWSWHEDVGMTADASLVLSEFRQEVAEVASVVAEARRTGMPVTRAGHGRSGAHLILAVPHGSNRWTSVTVPPRTRLIRDDPFSALIGLAPPATAEPPYSLTLAPNAADDRASRSGRWQRIGDELHGDWNIMASGGPTRVHVEVELRSPAALIQRGVLVVLLDVVLITVIWTLNAAADGGLVRWASARVGRWAASYRARLTFSLFRFFVVPAIVFAIWSYQRLRSDDRQSRDLLVRETLRAFTTSQRFDRLDDEEERLGAPLFLYADGQLRATSDSLYDEIAPLGRFLPKDIALTVSNGDEVASSARQDVGGVPTLVGYRAARIGSGAPRIVVATPARTDELALDRQRRDLGILVLFVTAAGALAALWLSGNTARTLARPIEALRRAALAIATGEREPGLAERPLLEFGPVFSAFRQMAADLSASRTALEEAQRRTAAVLRNVASGVIAVGPTLEVRTANPTADALLEQPLPPGTPLKTVAGREISGRVRAFIENERGNDEEEFDLELDGRQIHGRLARLARGGRRSHARRCDGARASERVLAWGEMRGRSRTRSRIRLRRSGWASSISSVRIATDASTTSTCSTRTWDASSPRSIGSTRSRAPSVGMEPRRQSALPARPSMSPRSCATSSSSSAWARVKWRGVSQARTTVRSRSQAGMSCARSCSTSSKTHAWRMHAMSTSMSFAPTVVSRSSSATME